MSVDAIARIKAELVASFPWSANDPRDPQAAPWPELTRGVLRSRVEAVIAELTSRGGNRAASVAEELAEILEANPGPRVPAAAFVESPWSAMIGPAVAPLLVNHWQAANALFDLGVVRVKQSPASGPLVGPPALAELIDTHGVSPGGCLGPPADVENPQSIASGVGPVRSRFRLEPSYFSNGHDVIVDILTILDPSGSETSVRIGVSVASGPSSFLYGSHAPRAMPSPDDRAAVTGPPGPGLGPFAREGA